MTTSSPTKALTTLSSSPSPSPSKKARSAEGRRDGEGDRARMPTSPEPEPSRFNHRPVRSCGGNYTSATPSSRASWATCRRKHAG